MRPPAPPTAAGSSEHGRWCTTGFRNQPGFLPTVQFPLGTGTFSLIECFGQTAFDKPLAHAFDTRTADPQSLDNFQVGPAVIGLRQAMDRTNDAQLTLRQLEALSLCAARPGEPIQKLAEQMHVSQSILRNLLASSYERLGVHNRTEAILKARELGLIASPSEGNP